MNPHQPPLALPGLPGLALPGMPGMPPMPGMPGGDPAHEAALRKAMAMGLPGHPPPPATPGKGAKGGRGAGGKKGEEEESEYEDEDDEDEDEDDEDGEDGSGSGGAQAEFVMGPNGLRRRRKRLTKKWTTEEDMILAQLVTLHGQRDWGLIARHMPGRFRKGKQCRERWRNQVRGWVNRRGDGWMGGWLGVYAWVRMGYRTDRIEMRLTRHAPPQTTTTTSWTPPSSATPGRRRRRRSCSRRTRRWGTSGRISPSSSRGGRTTPSRTTGACVWGWV